jgi:hypothetical protein
MILSSSSSSFFFDVLFLKNLKHYLKIFVTFSFSLSSFVASVSSHTSELINKMKFIKNEQTLNGTLHAVRTMAKINMVLIRPGVVVFVVVVVVLLLLFCCCWYCYYC